MIGYIAALLYGALTFLFLAVLGLQIGSPVVVFFIALAAASAYICQVLQVMLERSFWVAGVFWFLSVAFTILAIIAAGGKALVY